METVGGTIVTPARRRFPVKALAWMAVSPFAVWAAARIGGLERGSLTTQLMTATPYAAAGSLVSLLVAMAARNRPAAAVALVTSAALGFSVLPEPSVRRTPPRAGRSRCSPSTCCSAGRTPARSWSWSGGSTLTCCPPRSSPPTPSGASTRRG
ncbi:hypothetical protein [Nonomuraea recticatena]|uniref:hypothetical protein n=1 Tax=Nonomuraea recticatena TaxID=46178 RepID=UPI00360BE669